METRAYVISRIKELRKEKLGISAEELGSMLKPSLGGKAISSWETGRTGPSFDRLAQLSVIFEVPIGTFFPKEFSEIGVTADENPYTDVALYGSIAAGRPLAMIPVENTLPLPKELHKKYPQGFLLRVEGESMNKVLPNGSYALIDPEQKTPVNNAAYAFCVNQEDATIKRIKKLAHGYELLPDSNDPTLKPTVFDFNDTDPQEIIIIGRVVWMMLPFDWEI